MATRRRLTPLEKRHRHALGGQTLVQRSRAVPAAEKAAYHQIEGAGKRRVKREFFGLTAADEQVIVDRLEKAIDAAVKEA